MKIEELAKEAILSYEEDKIEDAIIYLETILEIEDNNIFALMMLSRSYSATLNFKKALLYTEKAYKYYPEELEVIFAMGYINQELNKNKKALNFYEKYIEKEKNYHIYLNMGICYMDLKYFKKAVDIINEAIKMEPNNPEGYFELADCYVEMEKYDEALKIYENKLKNMENVEEFYLYMKIAELYSDIGNIEEAIKYYNITINSEVVPVSIVYDKFYDLLIQEKKYDDIEILLVNYANSKFPKQASLSLEGKYSVFKKDYERAKKVCDKLIMLEPENPIYYFNLSYVLEQLNMFDEAIEQLEKGKKYFPDKELIRKNKIRLQSKKRRYLKKQNENRK